MAPALTTHISSTPRLRPSAAGIETRLHFLGLMMQARLAVRSPGGEAVSVGAGAALEPGDRLCAPRGFAGAHLAARAFETDPGSVGASSRAPDLLPLALGMALPRTDGTVLTLVGDDARGAEAWEESLELAQEQRARLVVVVDRVISAGGPRFGALQAEEDPDQEVDGGDLEAVLEATRTACNLVREEGGPAIVWCVRRRTPARAPFAARLDPIERYARVLLGAGVPRRRIEAALR